MNLFGLIQQSEYIKEPLIKSRLTAWHAICLHIFRHIAQKSLERRQPSCGISAQSDEKSDCASCAPDLISVSLNFRKFIGQVERIKVTFAHLRSTCAISRLLTFSKTSDIIMT